MAVHSVEAGQVIFKEGDPSAEAYIVKQGTIEILKKAAHGDVPLAELPAGALFGELGLFDDAPRSATARAKEASELEVITRDEFKQLLGQCPERLRAVVDVVFDRLRTTSKKLSERERATTIVECNFDKLTVSPASEALQDVFEPLTFSVADLPMRIGGFSPEYDGKPRDALHIAIPCNGPPREVSRRHLMIEVDEKENVVYLIDRGSRFGTIVNNVAIGKGKGHYTVALEKGEYTVQLGGKESPYIIKVVCE